MDTSWKYETYKKAREAAVDAYDNVLPAIAQGEFRKLPRSRELAIEQLTMQYLPVVRSEYPEDSWTPMMSAELSGSKANDWVKVARLNDRTYSPRYKAEKKTFEEYKNLVEDGKWLSMGHKELADKMHDLGFDPNNKASVGDFFKTLGDFDNQYNKAKIVDEFSRTPAGIATATLAPTAYNEAVKQALTDKPMSKSDVWKGYGIDATTGALMSKAVPMSNPVAATLATGGIEVGRQVAANRILDHEMHPENAIGAMGAAFTVPAGAKMLGGLLRQGSNDVRGFGGAYMRGVRGIPDPLKQEENSLVQLAKQVRRDERLLQTNEQNIPYIQLKGMASRKEELTNKLKALDYTDYTPGSLSGEVIKTADGSVVPLESFLDELNRRTNQPTGQKFSIGQVIDPATKEKDVLANLRESYRKTPDIIKEDLKTELTKNYALQNEGINRALGAETKSNLLKEQFRNKYLKEQGELPNYELMDWTEIKTAPKMDVLGYTLGRASAGLGGTMEAYTQLNPYAVVRDIAEGKSNAMVNAKTEDYKNQQWFKDMMENNPEMAKAIEAAFKKGKK